jgi:hypothetical protein
MSTGLREIRDERLAADMIGLARKLPAGPGAAPAARPIDVAAIVLDCSRIRRDLDWVASRPIEATIAGVWQSMRGDAPVRTARAGFRVA